MDEVHKYNVPLFFVNVLAREAVLKWGVAYCLINFKYAYIRIQL